LASRSVLDSGATVPIEGRDYPDYPTIAALYAAGVVNGSIDACLYIKAACRRYLKMLKGGTSEEGEKFYFSVEHAIEPCAFLETLHHIKGTKAGERLILEPWQIWMVCAIYGFRWSNDGLRVVNTVYAEIPRKQGKSLLAAGIGLYEGTVNAHIGDDIYIIAPKEDQAKKVLEPLQKMVARNRDLQGYYQIKSTAKWTGIARTDSQVIILAALGEKQDGHDPKTIIGDEFHAVPAEIHKVMKSSQRARPESLYLQIGSAGRHTFGIGWEARRGAIDVLNGKSEQLELFAAIYTIDPGDLKDWDTDRVIRKANPGYGVSVDPRKTMQEAKQARNKPSEKVEFLRTVLNLWGFSETALFPKENWDACARPGMTIEQMGKRRCWISLDLATRNDQVAMVALFEERTGELTDADEGQIPEVDLFAFAWHYVPEKGPWIEDADLVGPYRAWHEQGSLDFTPGSMHNFRALRAKLDWLLENFEVQMIIIDDQQANEFMTALIEAGHPVQAFRKNAGNFSDPTKDLMARINGEDQRFFHDGNPVLAWNASNVIGGYDTSDRILGKKPAPNSNQKIDGFDCLVMANAARLQMIQLDGPARQSATVEYGGRRF
jgi:phage terminase large subunit-like protein